MQKLYTTEEDHFIAASTHLTYSEISIELGRPLCSVTDRARKLRNRGLMSQRRRGNKGRWHRRLWWEGEERYILKWWGVHSEVEIAQHLARSVAACRARASLLGITSTDNWYHREGDHSTLEAA